MNIRLFWGIASWFALFSVIVLSLLSRPPDVDLQFEHADKLKHCFAYWVLSCAFLTLYHTRTCWVIGMLIALGVAIEFLQELGGARMFDVYDMLANTTGVLLGMLLLSKTRLGHFLNQFVHQRK